MATKSKVPFYQMLVFIAYGFFITIGLLWLGSGLLGSPAHFNPIAAVIVLAFGIQAYYRHLLTNLIFGVITMFFSIFMMLLPALNMAAQASKTGAAAYAVPLVVISLISCILSGILIFSYLKLNFQD